MSNTEDTVRSASGGSRDPARAGFIRPALRGAVDTLFRHRLIVFALWGLLTLGFAAFLLLSPREYEAEVTYLVRNNRADLVMSPDVLPATAQRIIPEVTDAQIATEVQMLSSRELALEVLDESGLGSGTGREREKALKKLREDLRVTPVNKSNMIRVRYSAPTAAQAARVLNTLSKRYLDRHLKLHSNSGSFAFFEQQTDRAGRELDEALRRLAKFQQRTSLINGAEQRTLLLQRAVELKVMLNQAEAESRDSSQRAASLKARLPGMSPRIATQMRRVPNQYSIERLNTLLAELRNKRTELLTKFKPDDRMVVQLNQQIADTERAAELAERRIATEEASDVNPLRQSVESELARVEANAAGMRGRIQAIRGQLSEYNRELTRIERLLPAEQECRREVKMAEENYLLYTKKREEARIGERMDREKIANVVLAEPAREPVLPKPRLSPAGIAAYLLGVALIALLGLMLGRLSQTVNTPWELEAIGEAPVLGTVPVRQGGGAPRRGGGP